MLNLEEIPLTPNQFQQQPNYGSNLKHKDKQYFENRTGFFRELAHRLNYPKHLFNYRRLVALYSFLLGFIGFILSIIMTELNLYWIDLYVKMNKIFIYICIMKIMITITTILLILLILAYNYLEMKIELIRHNVKQWKFILKWRRIIKILLEVVICSINPLPVFHQELYSPQVRGNELQVERLQYWARIDGILSLLMITRIYLLGRLLIARSNFYHNIMGETFGVVNRTALNTKFLFKSWINLYTGYILIIVICIIIIWGGWSFRVCEWSYTPHYLPEFLNSIYFTAITFISIGFGDYFPITICGKISASLIGILGAAFTALTVAMVSTKLNLNTTEKYLHNFINQYQYELEIREISAQIIQKAWLIHKCSVKSRNQIPRERRKGNIDRLKQDLFDNVCKIRVLKKQYLHLLSDDSIKFQEIDSAQSASELMLQDMNQKIDLIQDRLRLICDSLTANHKKS